MQYILGSPRLDTTNHNDLCLEFFHCSSAMNGLCLIEPCPNGRNPTYYTLFICIELGCSSIFRVLHDSLYL